MNFKIDKEELYLEQQARANWLQAGDKNTSFFHKFASKRHRFNLVKAFEFPDGHLTKDEAQMEGIAKRFFERLFQSIKDASSREHILSGIDRCITEDGNVLFMAPYRVDEVHQALKL